MKRRTRAKGKKPEKKKADQWIKLCNPMRDHFKSFIIGNASMSEGVVQLNEAKGQHIVICGAGPSLAETADEWCPQGDQVWGCNSALVWLRDNGHKVTHGFTVDQQPQMLDEWAGAPDVEYLLASSVHPFLTEFLQEQGRRTRFFHNGVGIKENPVVLCECGHMLEFHEEGTCCQQCECVDYVERTVPFEDWLYALLFESTIKAGAGLNTATRAIDVALFMGADRVTLLGADCAMRHKERMPDDMRLGTPEHKRWLEDNTIMHADGGHALASGATHVTLGAEIDGRWWESKPDLILSAIWLVHMARLIPELHLVGDTLPNALMHKPDEFLERLPALEGGEGDIIDMAAMIRENMEARKALQEA